jgi:hypothetical protein
MGITDDANDGDDMIDDGVLASVTLMIGGSGGGGGGGGSGGGG